PHHVPHPGLRHRVKRSRPAWVGAQRPARARRPWDQSAALRPGRDTTPSRPPGRRAPRPGASVRGPGCATRGDYGRPRAFLNRLAFAKPPPAASAPQQHPQSLSELRPARAQNLPPPAT
ncbi:unnamed protein product, partial [Gulo gulo]